MFLLTAYKGVFFGCCGLAPILMATLLGWSVAGYPLRSFRRQWLEKIMTSWILFFVWCALLGMANVILDGRLLAHRQSLMVLSLLTVLLTGWRCVQGKGGPADPSDGSGDPHDRMLIMLLCVVFLLNTGPVIIGILAKGDTKIHIGWASQLMRGVRWPHQHYLGAPMEYPWLFHVMVAFLTQVSCLSIIDVIVAITGMQCLLLAGGLYLLAQRLFAGDRESALWSLFWGCLYMGFAPASRLQGGRFGTPLEAGLHNVGPSRPRELCFAIALLFLVYLFDWAKHRRIRSLRLAVLTSGMMSLLHINGFLLSAVLLVVMFGAHLVRKQWRHAWQVCRGGLLALLVSLLYFLHMACNVRAFGPLVNTTINRGTSFTFAEIVLSFGLFLPLLAAGWVSAMRRRQGWFIYHWAMGLSVCFMLLGSLGTFLASTGEAMEIFYGYRWWPFINAIGAPYAVLAWQPVKRRFSRASRMRPALFLFMAACTLNSIVVWRFHVEPVVRNVGSSWDVRKLDRDPDGLIAKVRQNTSGEDVVAFDDPVKKTRRWFRSLTGSNFVWMEKPRLRNQDIWYAIPSQWERSVDMERVYSDPSITDRDMESLFEKYRVRYVIAPLRHAERFRDRTPLQLVTTGIWHEEVYCLYRVRAQDTPKSGPLKRKMVHLDFRPHGMPTPENKETAYSVIVRNHGDMKILDARTTPMLQSRSILVAQLHADYASHRSKWDTDVIHFDFFREGETIEVDMDGGMPAASPRLYLGRHDISVSHLPVRIRTVRNNTQLLGRFDPAGYYAGVEKKDGLRILLRMDRPYDSEALSDHWAGTRMLPPRWVLKYSHVNHARQDQSGDAHTSGKDGPARRNIRISSEAGFRDVMIHDFEQRDRVKVIQEWTMVASAWPDEGVDFACTGNRMEMDIIKDSNGALEKHWEFVLEDDFHKSLEVGECILTMRYTRKMVVQETTGLLLCLYGVAGLGYCLLLLKWQVPVMPHARMASNV